MKKAVVFDMNGVIINDERIHQESWRQYCREHGFLLSEEEFKHRVFGRSEKEILEYLYKRNITDEELEKDSNARVERTIAIYKPQIELAEGLKKLLDELTELSIPLAIATSSRRRYFEFIMTELDLSKHFKAVVTAEEISNGKPDPEIYLKAADAIHVAPEDCVAIEDTISGIKAAQAAGMAVIAIASTHRAEELTLANRVLRSFKDVDASALLDC